MKKQHTTFYGMAGIICISICVTLMLIATVTPAQAQKGKRSTGNKEKNTSVMSPGPGKVVMPDSFPGYVLFAPSNDSTTYLINDSGRVVHSWPHNTLPGMANYLRPNGNLLRAETIGSMPWEGGQISEYTWDNSLVWRFKIAGDTFYQSHDIYPMPNGNVLVDVWEMIPNNVALKMGRLPSLLPSPGYILCGMVVELRPVGNSAEIVWQWRFRDHLDSTGTHPQLLNINFMGNPMGLPQPSTTDSTDWMHMNALTYNSALDQIMISSRNLSEIYIIDHSTTTAQAAGHSGGRYGQGGDILYRWGNPQAYGAGDSADQQLFGQHSPYWLEEGYNEGKQIMVNNDGYPHDLTKINIIKPPVKNGFYMRAPYSDSAFGPAVDSLVYQVSSLGMGSMFRGNAELLPNGNLLIDATETSMFYMVQPASGSNPQSVVWEYQEPSKSGGAFRSTYYDAKHSGLRYMIDSSPKGKRK